MSSIQFYHATKRGLLIPWKPVISEIFKSRMDLLIGDRGGLILEPVIGVHQNVGELDFASLFGTISVQKIFQLRQLTVHVVLIQTTWFLSLVIVFVKIKD